MANKAFLETETKAWTKQRNELGACTTWRFTTEHARTKLAKLYLAI